MSDKQALLKVVEAMPDGATWGEITDRLIAVARHGSPADLVRLYRAQFGADQLAEYLDPKFEFALADVLSELEAASTPGAK